jgi:hypothetical protein
MVGKLQIPDFSKEAYPYDLTFAIKNPKFTEAAVEGKIPGWNSLEGDDYAALTVANNIGEGYVGETTDEETGEKKASKKAFNIWQTVTALPDGTKLPAGIYEVHVQGIARLCNNDSNKILGFTSQDAAVREAAYEAHKDQMPFFYANGEQTWLANPYVLPTQQNELDLAATNPGNASDWYTITFDGIYDETSGELRNFYIPNTRAALAERFASNRFDEDGNVDEELTKKSPWYDVVIRCSVSEEGKITFGWATDNAAPGTWAPCTNFRLFFVGGPSSEGYTGINEVNTTGAAGIEAVYTIDGRKANALQRGLNIVKSNGAVKKVIKK